VAKQTGLGWTTLMVDDAAGSPNDLRNDITNFDFATPYNTQDVTGVDKSAVERLALLADFSGTFNGVFNPSANKIHAVLGAGDLRVARTVSLTIGGKSLANEVLITSYAVTRAAGGELTTQSPFVLADGTVPTWT
jgi:hypothetical protein